MDPRALARAITAIENGASPSAVPDTSVGLVVGITGPPGAGKSTLVDALTREIRTRKQTVAILAVDPSSHITGGAILGDRIRMQQHHADTGVFIRSLATRGAAGGLARTTAAISRLLRSAGFDYILVETVGVGQDEIEIAHLADLTVLVLVPGMGDDIQALKAGVMEIAALYVVNKSDHPGAERTEQDLRSSERNTPILHTVATTGFGIPDLLNAIDAAPRGTRPAGDPTSLAVKSIRDALRSFESALGIKPGTLAVEFPTAGEVPIRIVRPDRTSE